MFSGVGVCREGLIMLLLQEDEFSWIQSVRLRKKRGFLHCRWRAGILV